MPLHVSTVLFFSVKLRCDLNVFDKGSRASQTTRTLLLKSKFIISDSLVEFRQAPLDFEKKIVF